MAAKQRKGRNIVIISVMIVAQLFIVKIFLQDKLPTSTDILASAPDRVGLSGSEGQNAETAIDLASAERASSRRREEASEGGMGSRVEVGKCLKWIVYDKPVKTGSTAVKDGLLAYFEERGLRYAQCEYKTCNDRALRYIGGEDAPRNLVGHQIGDDIMINALGKRGYYKVTSIREPKIRWESAFRFNRAMKGNHYAINSTASYKEFMERFPACALHHYYDNLGTACGDRLEQRVEKIVNRYDEIIDLYDTAVGQLHKRLLGHLRISNKSPVMGEEVREPFDETRLENETMLYNALRKRRLELAGHEPPLC